MVNNHALQLFHKAAKELPAYMSFLDSCEFTADKVVSAQDFKDVPVTCKDNYLRHYPLGELIWPDTFQKPVLYCATSGSTGDPFYFPRSERLSSQYSYLIEDFLSRGISKGGRTLFINGFGMGVWIGGIFTHRAFEIAGERMDEPLAILPVGYNKQEIFKALRRLAPGFDQTIISGYPPFIKELVDEAAAENIDLSGLNVRFLFAAEAFTERFRNYVCAKANISNPLIDTLNIYGTADIGAMAYETPVSILIRRLCAENEDLFLSIFGQIEKTPTLAQYNPDFMEFEEVDGEILLTGNNALPLIRYAVGDNGGVISYQRMENILDSHGIDITAETRRHGVDTMVQFHPFVYVYERKNLSATLHGILIYPEFIKEALLEEKLSSKLTERFTMITKADRDENQYLEINFEMQAGVQNSPELEREVLSIVTDNLKRRSSEFTEISKINESTKLIKVKGWPKNYEEYFAPGGKQKWTMKV